MLRSAPWKYKISAILFALINVYTIVCAVLVATKAAKQGGAVYSAMLFSVIITYGCETVYFPLVVIWLMRKPLAYLMASLLAFDPWHMITSFIPYILLSPTYINILNM